MRGLLEKQKQIVTELMMDNFVHTSLASMKILHKNHPMPSWHLPFYLLAATNLELCVKIFLLGTMERQGKTIREMHSYLQGQGHDLSSLYSHSVAGPYFLSKAKISEVKIYKESDDGLFRYDFYRVGSKDVIQVYDPESLKYGLMAKRVNVAFVAYQTDLLLKMCEDAYRATREVKIPPHL